VLQARLSTAASATAFLSTLPIVVTQAPLINGATVSIFPPCNCDNFVNGWTSKNIGEEGCARDNLVHGLQGGKTTCFPPARSYIPHLDDGCTSDSFRCIVTYAAPTFPTCVCDELANQAYLGMPNGLCQKNEATGNRKCFSRNYEGDKAVGGWEYFGCPEDSFRCK